ncbi:hypothetical protein G195_011080 [Phytophthora kernoviae 00238/432]|uniref:Peptidase S1 domain-containing protein n=1 Tax=Phytophthora kernoviae 00238/432 TaxID=1284355 RepID=A0A8J4S7B4_9STRA|nr:hypothetical protein G195_011080 [Phytophthora kernoviae 00238/432]
MAILQHPESTLYSYTNDFTVMKLEKPSSFKPVLKRANVQLMSNENCLKETHVDETMVCSRGVPNEKSCTGHYSGPLVVERPSGDVVVDVTTWGGDCPKPGYPSKYSRVSNAHGWIESTIGGECFH